MYIGLYQGVKQGDELKHMVQTMGSCASREQWTSLVYLQ